MNKTTLSFILLFISFSAFGQKSKTDTTYYQGLEVINDKNSFTTFEVCEIDRKGRRNGLCERFSKAGKLVESSNYKKGVKSGTYIRYSPLQTALIQGEYVDDMKDGTWITFDIEGNLNGLEIYKNDNLINSRKLDIKIQSKMGEEGILANTEVSPEFPGGIEAWQKFIAQNLTYPLEAKRSGAQGEVWTKFIVTKEGSIIFPKIIESPDLALSKEALRIVSLSPNWIPGKINGTPVDAELKFRLVFRLK